MEMLKTDRMKMSNIDPIQKLRNEPFLDLEMGQSVDSNEKQVLSTFSSTQTSQSLAIVVDTCKAQTQKMFVKEHELVQDTTKGSRTFVHVSPSNNHSQHQKT